MPEIPSSDAPTKPSLLRQLAPWLFALGILGYMLYKVDFQKVLQEMQGARASWIITSYLVYCAGYYLTDILSFYRSYNLFNTRISLAETARLRFASYAVQAINGALTEIMTVLYMFRVKKVPVLHSSSTAGFIYFCETLTMAGLLGFCAFFLPHANRINIQVPYFGLTFWELFQGLIIVAWVLFLLWLLFFSTGLQNLLPRVRDLDILTAFKQARLWNYVEVFSYRLVCNLVSIGANIVILKSLGIDAPVALLFAAVPIMVNVAYWPVSAGGFGGPQLAADYLFRGYATEEEILAYSLIWSALFFLSRTLTGVAFLKPVYNSAFPPQAAEQPQGLPID